MTKMKDFHMGGLLGPHAVRKNELSKKAKRIHSAQNGQSLVILRTNNEAPPRTYVNSAMREPYVPKDTTVARPGSMVAYSLPSLGGTER